MRNLPPWLRQQLNTLIGRDLERCSKWLAHLPEDTRLERQSRVSGLGSSPSLDDLDEARQHLRILRVRLDGPVENLLTDAELNDRARKFVERAAAGLTVDTANRRFDVRFSNDNTLSLLCLMAPDLVVTALTDAAKRDRASGTAAHVAKRASVQETARLRAEIRTAELIEEALIRRLHAIGVAVERRADADPAIMLGVDPNSVPVMATAA